MTICIFKNVFLFVLKKKTKTNTLYGSQWLKFSAIIEHFKKVFAHWMLKSPLKLDCLVNLMASCH